jgi:ParB family chromosome partitioning protein
MIIKFGKVYKMSNKKERFNLPTIDDLFERTHGSYVGRIEKIDINKLNEFKNHPFQVKDDEKMEQLAKSIKENGVLNPIIVRELENGKIEIVSGHRRKRASE